MTKLHIHAAFTTWCLVAGLHGIILAAPKTGTPKWEPYPVSEIRRIKQDKTLSDAQAVEALTRILDERISMAPLDPRKDVDKSIQDYSNLVYAIGKGDRGVGAPGRPEAVKAVLEKLDTLPGVLNKKELRMYLTLAVGFAGEGMPEDEILPLFHNKETPRQLTVLISQAMALSSVPIRALPRIVELSEDSSWTFLPGEVLRRPFQLMAYGLLNKLGIKCDLAHIKQEGIDEKGQKYLQKEVITVDRASLVQKLREWLLSDDPDVWKPTAEVVHRIPGDDVKMMLKELMGQLPDQKRKEVEKQRPTVAP